MLENDPWEQQLLYYIRQMCSTKLLFCFVVDNNTCNAYYISRYINWTLRVVYRNILHNPAKFKLFYSDIIMQWVLHTYIHTKIRTYTRTYTHEHTYSRTHKHPRSCTLTYVRTYRHASPHDGGCLIIQSFQNLHHCFDWTWSSLKISVKFQFRFNCNLYRV